MSNQRRPISRREFLALAAHGLLAVGTGCRTIPSPEPTAVPTLTPEPPSATPTPDLRARLRALVAEAALRQDQGVDISPVVPYLKVITDGLELGRPDLAEPLFAPGEQVLASLPPASPASPAAATVRVAGNAPGLGIPRLAGSLTIAQPNNDRRFQRFRQDILPGLVQMRLPLAKLNPARDNYPFMESPRAWQETFQQVNAGGGQVLLALQGIPSRLGSPAASSPAFAGRGPLAGPAALEEWGQIVGEVVAEFNRTPESRVALLQDIGEPNAGAQWLDPQDPGNPRPVNVESYVQHFRTTLQAARRADPDLLVGAPALRLDVNDAPWWTGFLGGLQSAGQPVDFASFHCFEANFGLWEGGVALARDQIARFGYSDLPLLATGWHAGPPRDLPESLRRSHMPAAHAMVGFLKQLEMGVAHTYASLGPGPDSGSVSEDLHLLEAQGEAVIPNPIYNAFLLFSRMHDKPRLPLESSDPGLFGLASFREDEILVLLTYYEPMRRDLGTPPDFPYSDPDWSKIRTFTLEVAGLPFPVYNIETFRIDRDHANFATLGAEGAELRRVSLERGEGTDYTATVEIPLFGVYLAVFSRQGG